MQAFETGVSFYTKSYAVVEMDFPERDICCGRCKYYDHAKRFCWLDKNIVPAKPDKYVGEGCPLMPKEEE